MRSKTIVKLLLAFVYIFSFIDLIPDFIPVAGWLDDIAVFLWMLNSLRKDFELLRKWQPDK